ncbi:endonuclease/exonuclease/phosphatase family protein [Aidingimonas lacisalsi]|uniref:endonuclease/exonuclease/phosphatase family protein n=1 Tax=Aidingimonas lacisalsi TaxID=2604086 RepID=UPI0011D2A1F5|nr:endonuclease/exonuclease/phosphatase family protein [Aidingimonas lacisalsi]
MVGLFLASVATGLLAATLLAKLPLHAWWIRACEFPRLQIAGLALLTLIGSLIIASDWQLPVVIACLIVLLIQGYRILPWTRLWPTQVKDAEHGDGDRHVTLLIANVLTTNRRSQALIELIQRHSPDIVLTLESDGWWQQQLDPVLDKDYPYSLKMPLDNLYGMHLYSRLPLDEPRIEWLIQEDIPSMHAWVQLPSGHRFKLHALHPRPPAPNESEESLWRDAELLLVGKEIHRSGEPSLVAGDLNDVAWSRSTRLFCRVSGMLDPRRGRGMYSTFHANYPLLRWPLDHVFVSEEFTLVSIRRLASIGSDHFPILTTFCYRPSRAEEHDPPEAAPEERQDANDTIDEAQARDQTS